MPNGGQDDYAACGFNRFNEGRWGTHSKPRGSCKIRHTEIPVSHWTYCYLLSILTNDSTSDKRSGVSSGPSEGRLK